MTVIISELQSGGLDDWKWDPHGALNKVVPSYCICETVTMTRTSGSLLIIVIINQKALREFRPLLMIIMFYSWLMGMAIVSKGKESLKKCIIWIMIQIKEADYDLDCHQKSKWFPKASELWGQRGHLPPQCWNCGVKVSFCPRNNCQNTIHTGNSGNLCNPLGGWGSLQCSSRSPSWWGHPGLALCASSFGRLRHTSPPQCRFHSDATDCSLVHTHSSKIKFIKICS